MSSTDRDPKPENMSPEQPDPLTDLVRRALDRPRELVPGLQRGTYRRGTYEDRRLRRERRTR